MIPAQLPNAVRLKRILGNEKISPDPLCHPKKQDEIKSTFH